MEKIKLFCVSLGCDKNLVDTEKMLGVAGGLGVSFTDDETEADAILINTCCFIGDAKEESVNTILEMARYKEEGKCRALIVAGCLAQRYKQEIIDEIPEVDAILGTTSYEEIGNYIKEGKADAGIGIIEEVGIGVSDELHNLLAEKDLYITHCKVQEDGGVRRKVVTFTDKLVVLPSHNRVKVMFECPNHSGSISSILSMISDYGVNLTEIHSRPFWKDNSWNYKFFVEMNANIDTKEIRALIYQLSQETAYLKILGSYACEGDF